MSKLRIYINGIEADLRGNEEIVSSHAVADIGDLDNRDGAYSNSFKLPKTARNKSIFDNAHVHNSTSRLPYNLLHCRISTGGVDFIGKARILSIENDFEIYVVAGNADFYKAIEGKKLIDLPLADLAHNWGRTDIADSWAKTGGYIYPIIDYHSDSPNFYLDNTFKFVDSRLLYPAVFVHTLIDKIFDAAGFTKSGAVFNFDRYKDLVLPFTGTGLGENTAQWKADREITITKSTDQVVSSTYDTKITFPTRTFDPFGFWDISGATSGVAPLFLDHFMYIYGEQFSGSILAEATVEKLTSGVATVYLCKDDGNYANLVFLDAKTLTASDIGTFTRQLAFDFNYDGLTVTRYYLICRVSGGGTVKVKSGYFKVINVNAKKKFGHNLTGANFVPDMLQSDLLFTVMLQFGLIPIQKHNNVKFVQFREILANRPSAKDWSLKVDLSEAPKTTFRPPYAQRNIFKYKDDNTLTTDFGAAFLIADVNLEKEKTAISLPISFCETVQRMNGISMAQIPMAELGAMKNKAQTKITRISRQSMTINLFEVAKTNTTAYTRPVAIGTMDGLSPAELLDENYQELVTVLNNFKETDALIRLDAVDVASLDFSTPVYIKQIGDLYGGYYYINLVEQFNHSRTGSTIVKLIKI